MHPWLHFKTITRHKLLVMKYCFQLGLYKQGLLHDLSKYSPSEFLVGARYYQGTRSPNNAERENIGVSTSWLHHKGRNKHHFEHWVDYSLESGTCRSWAPGCLGNMWRKWLWIGSALPGTILELHIQRASPFFIF